jgi:hypothetical protein
MPQKLNSSEEFVHWVCQRSFLSLWSYASPRGKKGKELCDVLVVCEPDVIIISVKDIKLADADESGARSERWTKRAVDDSVKQIYGAERWIATAKHIVRLDSSAGLPFPPLATRRVHRVAVAFGADGKASFSVGDFGKGYVHVFDERSFQVVLSELDTITDFIEYLAEKQRFTSRAAVVFEGEENLLALYVHGGRRFPENADFLVAPDGMWDALKAKPEFERRQLANQDSYVWDRLIETLASDILDGNLEIGPGLAESERGVRVMARENRFYRRLLGRGFAEFLLDARSRKTKSRLMQSPSGVGYVLLRMPPGEDREGHLQELHLRCFVARGFSSGSSTVIGIGVSDGESQGFSLTVLYYDHPVWTDADAQKAREMQDTLDYFRASRQRRLQDDEYPRAPTPEPKRTIKKKKQDRRKRGD